MMEKSVMRWLRTEKKQFKSDVVSCPFPNCDSFCNPSVVLDKKRPALYAGSEPSCNSSS